MSSKYPIVKFTIWSAYFGNRKSFYPLTLSVLLFVSAENCGCDIQAFLCFHAVLCLLESREVPIVNNKNKTLRSHHYNILFVTVLLQMSQWFRRLHRCVDVSQGEVTQEVTVLLCHLVSVQVVERSSWNWEAFLKNCWYPDKMESLTIGPGRPLIPVTCREMIKKTTTTTKETVRSSSLFF